MKKYILMILGIIIFFIWVNSKNSFAYPENECIDKIDDNYLFSTKIVDYVESNNINIDYLCTLDYCEKILYLNFRESFDIYREKFLEYIEDKVSIDEYNEFYYKGFKIDRISIRSCEVE